MSVEITQQFRDEAKAYVAEHGCLWREACAAIRRRLPEAPPVPAKTKATTQQFREQVEAHMVGHDCSRHKAILAVRRSHTESISAVRRRKK